MKTTIFTLLIISVSLLASIGKVDKIEGKAFIKNQTSNSFQKLTNGFEVDKGDVIRTSNNATLSILFDDESKLTVYQKSIIKIDKNITDKNNSKSITLFSGKLWAKIHKRVTKKDFFKVNTPTATAGVRGTSFGVVVSSNGSSLVRVNSGRVLFDSDLDPRALKEEKKDEKKIENNTTGDITLPKELNISTSKINRVDESIDIDKITGIKKKSIVLGKDSTASFRLNKGIKAEAEIPIIQFETEEIMPENQEKRKEIISWHISNLEHRVKTANHLVFRVSKISGDIESMKSDKKFTVEQISSSEKEGQKEIEHLNETVESMENSMDAQLYFLENVAKDNPEAKKVFEKHDNFLKEKEKALNNK
jgi:hypothetical protein